MGPTAPGRVPFVSGLGRPWGRPDAPFLPLVIGQGIETSPSRGPDASGSGKKILKENRESTAPAGLAAALFGPAIRLTLMPWADILWH